MNVPNVVGFLVRIIDGEECHGAGVRIGEKLFMRFEERVEHAAPAQLSHTPILVQRSQLVGSSAGGEANALEQRVAHQHGEAAAVDDDGVRGTRGRGVQGRAGVLPFVHQAGVDRADHQAKPGHHVVELFVALVVRDGAVQRTVGLGEVAQQDALAAGDVVAGDVALEVAAALQHVAQDALGRELVVAGPRHLGAVLFKGRGEHVF